MKTINDRYTIINKLGQGGSSITYTAKDKETGDRVAIKALSLTGLEDWKKIELFEREAKILQQLDHPAIPKYIDYFQVETDDNVYFYIVQQLAPGQSLAHLISQGWIPEEQVVKDIAEQILEVLIYLQQLTPPVIHRDIKPQNIIYQPDTGKLFLVDFGAVQDTYHHTVMGSTVVGTYGYMAPEQFRGGAVLSTDLYGLGCTLLFLLTGKPPVDLPQKKLKIDFRHAVKLEHSFANWIDKLIEPNVRQRFPKAESALLVLQEKKPLAEYDRNILEKPRYSSIKVWGKEDSEITFEIPPAFKRKKVDSVYYFWLGWSIISILNRLAIFVSITWIGKLYILSWFYSVIFIRNKRISIIIEALFCVIFLFMLMFGYNFSIPSFSIYLLIADFCFNLLLEQNFIAQLLFKTQITSDRKENTLTITNAMMNSRTVKTSKYQLNKTKLPKLLLTTPEKNWLRSQIEEHLRNQFQ